MAAAQTRRAAQNGKVKKGSGAILVEPKPREGPIDPGTRRALAALKRLSQLGPYNFRKLKP